MNFSVKNTVFTPVHIKFCIPQMWCLFEGGIYLKKKKDVTKKLLKPLDFDYIRTKALIVGGGGGGHYQLFCPNCGTFLRVMLNQGRHLLEHV